MELKPYLRRPHFYETDGMNIVWHGNYIAWMEEARTDFMDQIGFPYSRATDAGIDFALTDVACKYRAMTRFGEEVAISLTINYLRPTPVDRPLYVRVHMDKPGHVTHYLSAEAFTADAPDKILATASGVYLALEK